MAFADSVPEFVKRERPDRPVFCYRPDRLSAAGRWFAEHFPGECYYAVKANPAPHILGGLWQAGIHGFDVASMDEVEQVARQLPDARLAYMHPVKSRGAIARAYHEFGVRRFVLDCEEELDKIWEATGQADDLYLVVRIAVSNEGASVPLHGKFGASQADVPGLLRAARSKADELGISFHVGSQSHSPHAWHTAMADASALITRAAVTVDVVDVGGGFPSLYPGRVPPDLDAFMHVIDQSFETMMVLENAELWCEPGRALVAEAESLLVRVEAVRDDAVYINDGGFGALYDAVHLGWDYPIRTMGENGLIGGDEKPFTVYGPTCDSADRFAKPLVLPKTIRAGDYIEFGQMGAYGRAMASRFNGYGAYDVVTVGDAPFETLFQTYEAAGTVTSLSVSNP
ncbi:MAG: type III PLP-dependent enzyme [Pseudomonadota bacterium]